MNNLLLYPFFIHHFSSGKWILKCVSFQPDWTLLGFNESFMDFIRFIAEQGNWNEKVEWR